MMKEQLGGELLQYDINVEGKRITAMVDTGAQLSLLLREVAERLGVEWDKGGARKDLVGAGGETIDVVGKAKVGIAYKEGVVKEEVLVAHPLRHQLILGLPWIRKHAPTFDWNDLTLVFLSGEVWRTKDTDARMQDLRCIKNHSSELEEMDGEWMVVAITDSAEDGKAFNEQTSSPLVLDGIRPILTDYSDVFEPLTGIPPEDRIQHGIDLIPGAKPVMKRPYRLSEAQQEEVKRQVEFALTEGWVQPSFSPWGTAIFVVAKKNSE